jgi:hypothetical protein
MVEVADAILHKKPVIALGWHAFSTKSNKHVHN